MRSINEMVIPGMDAGTNLPNRNGELPARHNESVSKLMMAKINQEINIPLLT